MKLKLISDGTNSGTKLINEDTGEMVHGISKISWEANAADILTKVSVELFNIPVEIVSKAEVETYQVYPKEELVSISQREVRITAKENGPNGSAYPHKTFITDAETNEPIGTVQKVKWEATPEGIRTKIERLNFR